MDRSPADPLVFGVLNVTPDSFSDGGRHLDPAAAVAHGLALAEAGADVVDVGGESTRPGAQPVPVEKEARRVVPVVARLVAAGVRVSVDTRRGIVAARAIDAGAAIVNDVSGGVEDTAMLATVAAAGVEYVLVHSRGAAGSPGRYGDVVADVAADLAARVSAARAAGIERDRLIVDPGIGFAKTAEQNWRLLAHLDALRVDGLRMLVGVSRKRFLGALLPPGAAPEQRDPVTAVLSALLAERAIWAVRVHDVVGTRAAIAVVRCMRSAA